MRIRLQHSIGKATLLYFKEWQGNKPIWNSEGAEFDTLECAKHAKRLKNLYEPYYKVVSECGRSVSNEADTAN
jgi:hypothetical protein